METVELPPFASAIAAGADAILTAHVCYPKIDPMRLPATLSSAIINGVLRKRMGFEGVVVSDAIEMNAIANRYGQTEAAALAVAAGVVVILTVGWRNEQRAIHRALVQAVRDGRLPEERAAEAAMRVLRAKAGLNGQRRDGDGRWPLATTRAATS